MINKELKKINGVVYTPLNFAEYVAEKLVQYYFDEQKDWTIEENFNVIDPACGEGQLLLAMQKALVNTKLRKNLSKQIVALNTYGIDIDKDAIKVAKKRLRSIDKTTNNFKFFKTNALLPLGDDTKKGWEIIKSKLGAMEGFDMLIANPPWGADIKSFKDKLGRDIFLLNKGQVDSSDLFIELSLSIVKENGYFAFILPDALFNGGKKDLRKMLVKRTEIKFIGRFGEKIFKNINMSCVVIICKNVIPSNGNRVSCLHLTPYFRKKILAGETNFAEVEKILSHTISQNRFEKDKDYLLDIDTREDDILISQTFKKNFSKIGDYLTSSRGIELSKSGKICRCKKCQLWMPVPLTNLSKCIHCKTVFALGNAEISTIISKNRIEGSYALLVGESIKRYAISSRYWINLQSKGINYKDISIYNHPKILIRKTGVGITATIDYSQSMTNQVVYMFRSKSESENSPPLELFLAIINSRAMYYQLVKKYGETEWRSHPYLTQKQILDLPLPHLETQSAKILWKKIQFLLKPYLSNGNGIPSRIDAQIEFYIAQLYNLSGDDYDQIYKALNNNQDLLPVKALKQISRNDIFSLS